MDTDDVGSNPTLTTFIAGVTELADVADLKSAVLVAYGFKSHHQHQS